MGDTPSIASTSIPASSACGRAAFSACMGESQFGSYLKGEQTGALLPPNAAALYPIPFDEETTLTSVVFTQFLAKWFGIYLGKIDTFGGDANAFAHDWKTQFMNTGFGPNPVLFNTIPYSTLGAGFLLLPTESVVFNFSALSPGEPPIAPASTICSRKGWRWPRSCGWGSSPSACPGTN